MDAVFQPLSFDYRGIPLSVQREWYKIRDLFLGENERTRNIPLALKLAAKCFHPEAQWLTSVCAGHNLQTMDDARPIFRALWKTDMRALCFSYFMYDQQGCDLIQSAEAGYPFAQATVRKKIHLVREGNYAKAAAASGERDGFFELALSLFRIGGPFENTKEAKKYFLYAARLGHSASMKYLGFSMKLSSSCNEQWYWICLHAKTLCKLDAEEEAFTHIFEFRSGSKNLCFIVFMIGWYFFHAAGFRVGGSTTDFAINHYKQQCAICKDAVQVWLVFARRWNICKDLRKLVGKLIWQTRGRVIWADILTAAFGRGAQ